MKFRFVLLSIAVFPILAFSQTSVKADSAEQLSICNNRTYTKVEFVPVLNITKQAFADSITTYLIFKEASPKDEMVDLKFILSCNSQITDVEIFTNISYKQTLIEALQKFSNLWLPARQGKYAVKYYTKLILKFENHKLADIMLR